MKQGINIHLPVKFSGVTMANVSRIDFVFKQNNRKNDTAIKESTYKYDGSGDAQLKTGSTDTILIPWTKAETYDFAPGVPFFMDTIITMSNSADNPETNIVKLTMNSTLFEEEES